MNRKATTHISILILTIGVLAVFVAAGGIFLSKQDTKQIQIQSPEILDEVYAKEAEINFYIMQTMREASKHAPTEEQFIQNFKNEIQKRSLKTLIPELENIDEQLITENVEFTETEMKLKLKFKIERTGTIKDREATTVGYIYEKEFTIKAL